MEREKIQTAPAQEKPSEQGSEPNSPSSLEVENEEPIQPVDFATKSGCGRCG